MLRGRAEGTQFIVFGLSWLGLEPTIHRTNHYTTKTVYEYDYILKAYSSLDPLALLHNKMLK
jgi:hypothetical protein